MPKFYLIMKYTFESVEDAKSFKKRQPTTRPFKSDYADGDGSKGTNGNPDNHFPSVRIKMHELNRENTNPLIVYTVLSTSY